MYFKKFKDALNDCLKAMNLCPNKIKPQNLNVEILFNLGKFDDVVAFCSQKENSQDPNQARILNAIQEFKKAQDYYNRQ
jgi:hypothetical protein